MDPINLVVQALLAGASELAKDKVNDALSKRYNQLLEFVKRRFGNKLKKEKAEEAINTLSKFQEDPQTYLKPIKEELAAVEVKEDLDILNTAQMVLEIVKSLVEKDTTKQIIYNQDVGTQTNIASAKVVNIGMSKKSKKDSK